MTTLTTTIRERVEKAFPLTVDKFPLTGPDGMATNRYGLFTSDGKHVPGTAVSKGYEPHTRDDIAAAVEACCLSFASADDCMLACHWSGTAHRVIVSPTDEYRRRIHGTNDSVWPRAVIYGGYLWEGVYFNFGLYRDACKNLMMPRKAGVCTSRRFRHTTGLRDRIDDMVQEFSLLNESYDGVINYAERLESKRHSVSDFVSQIYPLAEDATNRQIRGAQKRAAKIVDRIIRERSRVGKPPAELGTATLWELVNGITGYVQHDKPRKGGQATAVAAALRGVEDNDSQRAWELAATLLS